MEIGFQRDDDNVEKGKGFAHKKVSNLKSDDRIFKLRNFQVEWNSNGKRATERLAISCSANEPCFASNINFMKKLKQHKIDFSHFYAVAVRVCVCVCERSRNRSNFLAAHIRSKTQFLHFDFFICTHFNDVAVCSLHISHSSHNLCVVTSSSVICSVSFELHPCFVLVSCVRARVGIVFNAHTIAFQIQCWTYWNGCSVQKLSANKM